MEDASHELDIAATVRDTQAGSTYERYVTAFHRQSHLKEEVQLLQAQVVGLEQLVTLASLTLPNATTNPQYRQLCTEVASRKARVRQLVS